MLSSFVMWLLCTVSLFWFVHLVFSSRKAQSMEVKIIGTDKKGRYDRLDDAADEVYRPTRLYGMRSKTLLLMLSKIIFIGWNVNTPRPASSM